MTTVPPLEAAIEALATALREAGAPFMLIGGIAVIARGVAVTGNRRSVVGRPAQGRARTADRITRLFKCLVVLVSLPAGARGGNGGCAPDFVGSYSLC